MTRGEKTLRRALSALTVMLIAAALLPVAPAAAQQEYDLNLPGAGSGGSGSGDSSGDTTAPAVVPTAPTGTVPTIPTDATGETLAVGGGKGRKGDRDRNRPQGPTDPVLTTSGVNATAGPQEIPKLRIEADDEGGVPTLALVLASLAAACCILALWRLRFLRELPAAPRPQAPGATSS